MDKLDHWSEDLKVSLERDRKKIKQELAENHSVHIDMLNFTMYSPEDLDGNGELDDVLHSNVGAHEMKVVDVTDDGGLVVTSWGKKYIVYPNATMSGRDKFDNEDILTDITIFDY